MFIDNKRRCSKKVNTSKDEWLRYRNSREIINGSSDNNRKLSKIRDATRCLRVVRENMKDRDRVMRGEKESQPWFRSSDRRQKCYASWKILQPREGSGMEEGSSRVSENSNSTWLCIRARAYMCICVCMRVCVSEAMTAPREKTSARGYDADPSFISRKPSDSRSCSRFNINLFIQGFAFFFFFRFIGHYADRW